MEPRRHRFTLVEMLVVTVVIAVLASLLLPALRQAKLKTYQIQDISNIRQLLMAFDLYTLDYNRFTPCPQEPAQCYDYGGWVAQIQPHFGQDPYQATSAYFCPFTIEKGTWGPSLRHWRYAMNHDIRCNASGTRADKKTSEVVDPSKAMVFTENGCYNDVLHGPFLEYGFYGHPAGTHIAAPAHGGLGIPFGYLDGHAQFWGKVPDHSVLNSDFDLPWTHKRFWGIRLTGASTYDSGMARGTYVAPYNP